jgi:hypothetical protein
MFGVESCWNEWSLGASIAVKLPRKGISCRKIRSGAFGVIAMSVKIVDVKSAGLSNFNGSTDAPDERTSLRDGPD